MSVFLNNARGPRGMEQSIQSGTDESIGPGQYPSVSSWQSGLDSSNVQQRSQGRVKRFYQERERDEDMVVGPGSYDQHAGTIGGGGGSTTQVTSACDRAMDVTCSAFRARSPQISPMVTCPGASAFLPPSSVDTPGPGQYEKSRDIRGAPRLRAVVGSAPLANESIQGPGDTMVGPGPAAYSPTLAKPTALICDWHASNTLRKFIDPEDFPGPGTYPKANKLDEWGIDGLNSSFESLTRRPGMEALNAELVPGPGAYIEDVQTGSLDGGPSSVFNSTSQRDSTHGAHLPGPGTYAQPGSSFLKDPRRSRSVPGALGERTFHGITNPSHRAFLRDTDGVRMIAFHSSQARPVLTPALPEVGKTGPGQYSPDECPSRSLVAKVRSKSHIGRNGKFVTNSERFPQRRQDCPTELHEKIALSSPVREEKRAFQVGGVQRLHMSKSDSFLYVSDAALQPCPGSYEDINLQKVNYRSKLARPSNEHFGFGCGQDRFRGSVAAGVDPGAYDTRGILATRCAGGMVKGTGGRSQCLNFPDTGDVGPGAYDANPASALLRKSFNVAHAAHAKSVLAAVSAAASSTSQMLALTDDGSQQYHTSASTLEPRDSEEEPLQLPEHHIGLVHMLEQRAEAARKRVTSRIPRLKQEGVIVS